MSARGVRNTVRLPLFMSEAELWSQPPPSHRAGDRATGKQHDILRHQRRARQGRRSRRSRRRRPLLHLAGAGGGLDRQDLARLSLDPGGRRQARGQRARPHRQGPWANAKGVQIASDAADLHGANNKVNKETALDEHGATVNGRGDTPNKHDMLTGTKQDGIVASETEDVTCSNWTSSADGQGSAMVGHHDLIGNSQGINFWNYSHKTPGCAPPNLQRVGGAGLFYCFAAN